MPKSNSVLIVIIFIVIISLVIVFLKQKSSIDGEDFLIVLPEEKVIDISQEEK